ncbi:class I SAM-dependent methyltransferase [Leptolyngbya sp. 15MV]|nr:class I SAM-dependent methyltransferase [Leptolyngbya sp. 15MV]
MLGRLSRLGRGAAKRQGTTNPGTPNGPDSAPVTAEAATWAMRLLIGREPKNEQELAIHQRHQTLGALRASFMQTSEFRALHPTHIARKPGFAIPPFLMRPPADPTIPWRFEQPTLAHVGSQLCTASQFQEPVFGQLIADLKLHPGHHRKLWEHAFVLSVLLREAMVGPGRRGVKVLATDAPTDETPNQGWATTNQFAAQAEDLFFAGIVGRKVFDRLVSFRPVDMNAIPADLNDQFDACWSTCSLEHLGSLQHGLDFIENSLNVLRPGGIAVHTTEFNLTSNDETLELPSLALFRRRDIERLAARLIAAGHTVAPLNFHPGHEELDEVIDVPPYSRPHLKLLVAHYTITSIGLIVRKKA